jgi:hypothetical protein
MRAALIAIFLSAPSALSASPSFAHAGAPENLAREAYEPLFVRGSSALPAQFTDLPNRSPNPYRWEIKDGRLTYSGGEGDFGLLWLRRPLKNFQLRLRLRVPAGDFVYANSGLFLGFEDPREAPPAPWRAPFEMRSPGFAAEASGYELQLHAGREHDTLIPGRRNGTFYDDPAHRADGAAIRGRQHPSDYRFRAGETYEVVLRAERPRFRVWMKPAAAEGFTLVNEFTNEDPVRGWGPYLGLQSYYNDGGQHRAMEYEEILLHELPAQ